MSTLGFLASSDQAYSRSSAPPPLARRSAQGFTLVELVVAAGLIGFLALTATFFWVDGLGLVTTVNTDSAAIADGRVLMERLAREIREVKYDRDNGAYCISTLGATQMVFNKTTGTAVSTCGGANPTGANNDIAVTIQVPANTTNLNLGYAGTLATPATTKALTTYVASPSVGTTGFRYLTAGYTTTTLATELRFVEVTLTLQPPGVQATQTRTVVALRNN